MPLHVSSTMCWSSGGQNCIIQHLVSPYRTKHSTTNVVIQQNSRKLLMMDILMSETCWAHKKWNKITSDIKLAFYSSSITMMHGPINIRFIPVFYVVLTEWKILRFIEVWVTYSAALCGILIGSLVDIYRLLESRVERYVGTLCLRLSPKDCLR